MRFSLAIYGSPKTSLTQHSALRFAKAVVRQKHQLLRAFFYDEATLIAGVNEQDPELLALRAEWAQLHARHDLELAICISSARRAGALNDVQDDEQLPTPFLSSGLGQLVVAALDSDRLISFLP